jgi:hypothetical protein
MDLLVVDVMVDMVEEEVVVVVEVMAEVVVDQEVQDHVVQLDASKIFNQ